MTFDHPENARFLCVSRALKEADELLYGVTQACEEYLIHTLITSVVKLELPTMQNRRSTDVGHSEAAPNIESTEIDNQTGKSRVRFVGPTVAKIADPETLELQLLDIVIPETQHGSFDTSELAKQLKNEDSSRNHKNPERKRLLGEPIFFDQRVIELTPTEKRRRFGICMQSTEDNFRIHRALRNEQSDYARRFQRDSRSTEFARKLTEPFIERPLAAPIVNIPVDTPERTVNVLLDAIAAVIPANQPLFLGNVHIYPESAV